MQVLKDHTFLIRKNDKLNSNKHEFFPPKCENFSNRITESIKIYFLNYFNYFYCNYYFFLFQQDFEDRVVFGYMNQFVSGDF